MDAGVERMCTGEHQTESGVKLRKYSNFSHMMEEAWVGAGVERMTSVLHMYLRCHCELL